MKNSTIVRALVALALAVPAFAGAGLALHASTADNEAAPRLSGGGGQRW